MSRAVKGLLVKDFILMKTQMRFFLFLMLVWGIFMASALNMSFFVGYIAVLCAFLTLTTFNYDEFENGSAYLFTLPISRKDYIFGKYVFGFLITTLPFIAVGLLIGIVLIVQGTEMSLWEYLLSISTALPMGYLLLMVEIPLQVKFGQEKSKVITVILVGCVSACLGMIGHLYDIGGVSYLESVSSIAGLGEGLLVLMIAAAIAVLMFLSYKLSCRFMEKKEF